MLVLFSIVGCFGALAFRDIDGNILNNLAQKKDAASFLCRAMLVFALTLSSPLLVFPIRTAVQNLFGHSFFNDNLMARLLLSVCTVGVATAVAISELRFSVEFLRWERSCARPFLCPSGAVLLLIVFKSGGGPRASAEGDALLLNLWAASFGDTGGKAVDCVSSR